MRDMKDYADSIGAPAEIDSDSPPMLIGRNSNFAKKCWFLSIKQNVYKPETQQQNDFDGETRLFKCCWKNSMATNNSANRVWDYVLVYEAGILSIIARGQDGVPGLEKLTGDTVDITEYLDFAF